MGWLTANFGIICTVLSAIIGVVGAIFGVLKGKAGAGKVLKGLASVIKQFPDFIRTAEKVGVTGEEKLRYVLNQAVLSCKALGFTPTEEQLIDMTEQIDEMVKLSKQINLHSKTVTTTDVTINPVNTTTEINKITPIDLGGVSNEN